MVIIPIKNPVSNVEVMKMSDEEEVNMRKRCIYEDGPDTCDCWDRIMKVEKGELDYTCPCPFFKPIS
jgi:hypothetical protein